jgi:hypothetical protein
MIKDFILAIACIIVMLLYQDIIAKIMSALLLLHIIWWTISS